METKIPKISRAEWQIMKVMWTKLEATANDVVAELSEKNIGILITDHNVRDTLEITHRSYIINLGEILAAGNKEEILANSMARQIYLGHEFRM